MNCAFQYGNCFCGYLKIIYLKLNKIKNTAPHFISHISSAQWSQVPRGYSHEQKRSRTFLSLKNIPLARAGWECDHFMGQKLNVLIFVRLATVRILWFPALRKKIVYLTKNTNRSLILSMQRKINPLTLKPKFLVDLCRGVGKIYGHSWFAVVNLWFLMQNGICAC